LRLAFLILTTACNRRCAYCFYETEHQDRGNTSLVLPVDHRLLSGLSLSGVQRLILTGGEPLLVPDLEDIVRLASENGFDTLLLTNGDHLHAGRLKALRSAGLSGVSISLDDLSIGAESKAPWNTLEMVALQDHLRAAVITPVTRMNLEFMPEIIRRVRTMGLYLLLQPVYLPEEASLFEGLSLRMCTDKERMRLSEVLRLWEDLYGKSGYADLVRRFYSDSGGAHPAHCTMGTETVVIDSNGDVLPCFHRRDLKPGNVLTGDPMTVLPRSFELGAQLRSAPCFGEHCISLFSHM
jgi:MoaA/NifB/PqqE/SkfB family radical SAM enzyme